MFGTPPPFRGPPLSRPPRGPLRRPLALLALLAFVWACDAAPVISDTSNVNKPHAAPIPNRARLIVPRGWERDVLAIVRPALSPAEADLAARQLDVTGVLDVPWTAAVAATVDGLRADIAVEWVRPNRSWQSRPNAPQNRNAADTSNVDALMPGGATGFDLTGQGVTLGEWDEGVPRLSHRELRGRVRVVDGAGPRPHSTQVAGTMIATGLSSLARGMANAAQLRAHDWTLDSLEMHALGSTFAATNHSYGAILGWDVNANCDDEPSWLGQTQFEDPAFGKYGAAASMIDAVIHARDMAVVWAAGNERGDSGAMAGTPHYHWPDCSRTYTDAHAVETTARYDTLGGQATLKNAVVVGAVRDITTEPPRTSDVVIEDYSSVGPMDDGRIKPDLVACGQNIVTTDVDADDAYTTASGTSLAAPAVSGAIALLTEKYRQTNQGRDPRGAEMKTLLVHTALEAGTTPGPDYEFGFGLMDARAAAELLHADGDRSSSGQQLRSAVLRDGEDERFSTTETVPPGSALRVTLAWHDPAGAPNGAGVDDPTPALVNDLDVELVAPDQQTTFRPWRLTAANPSAGATRSTPNRADNVEVIDVDAIDNVWAGRWSVRVSSSGPLSPRGHAQAFAIASSVPLTAPLGPVLGIPRTILVEAPLGSTPTNVVVPVENLGSGSLSWSLSESVPWLTSSTSAGVAPGGFDLAFDVTNLSGPADHVGVIEIDSSDAAGPRVIAVVLRLTCAPQCGTRQCGIDPVCGESCGRCPDARACSSSGACVAMGATCPVANLGSQLGVVAEGNTVSRSALSTGSCGGETAKDVTFQWTAPEAGRFEFTTSGSDFDTLLYVRDGGCAGPELACNDDTGGVTSTVSLQLAAAQTVFVTVDGYDADGGYVLSIDRSECRFTDLGSRLGGTVLQADSLGAPNNHSGSCGGALGGEVVARWTAPAEGEYRFSTEGTADDVDTVLYLLDAGCDGAELSCRDARNGSDGVHVADTLLRQMMQGESVAIVVDGRRGEDAGVVALHITATQDTCDGACGGTPNGTCFCDASCVGLGDCCSDACLTCGQCTCDAACGAALCGDDGCGGSCGTCQSGMRCDAGACVVDPCADVTCATCEACVEGACVALPELAACDDGLRCTVEDQCVAGACAGSELVCDDGNVCTMDACQEVDGLCAFVATVDCCVTAQDCADGDTCTADRCDMVANRCEYEERAMCCRGADECTDGDPCTHDRCVLGTCLWEDDSTCGLGDAGSSDGGDSDAGWSNAKPHGGGCDCRVTATGNPQTRTPYALSGMLWLGWLARVMRRSRRRRSSERDLERTK